MKKIISMLLVVVMCFALCSCGSKETSSDVKEKISNEGEEEKKTTSVEITLDNWQEYFEIRFCETFWYNNFGEVTQTIVGQAFYLKEEFLSKLVSTESVGFKTIATCEHREYDMETNTFVEGGRIYYSEKIEITSDLMDDRMIENTDDYSSTCSGQVVAEISAGIGVEITGDVAFKGVVTDDIEVIDATGTLIFEE